MCILSGLSRSAVLSASPCVIPSISGGPFRAAALLFLAHKSRVCVSSALYVCKFCQRKKHESNLYVNTNAHELSHRSLRQMADSRISSRLHTYTHRREDFGPVQSTCFYCRAFTGFLIACRRRLADRGVKHKTA